ncbi:MAG TPA: enoyl-CoA hydratase/isomerase family protein [Acidimicrobiales bacterium]
MTDSAAPILVDRRGHVAHLVLNRPDKLNALDLLAFSDLHAALDDLEADPGVRVVVVRGEGRAFCTGVDLDMTGGALADSAAIDRVVSVAHRTFARLEASPLPSVAAIHGMALAGGLELVLACDLALAATDARLGDFHARYGLFPGGGASQRLPRVIGERRAKWLLLSGEWVTGSVAAEWGLVNEAVEPDRLVERADEVAQLLARRSPLLSSVIKQTVRVGARMDLPTALEAERPLFLRYMASEHARMGLDAFATRTEPVFPDR